MLYELMGCLKYILRDGSCRVVANVKVSSSGRVDLPNTFHVYLMFDIPFGLDDLYTLIRSTVDMMMVSHDIDWFYARREGLGL